MECGSWDASVALGAGLPTPPKPGCKIVEQLSSTARAVRLGALPSDWGQSLYERALTPSFPGEGEIVNAL